VTVKAAHRCRDADIGSDRQVKHSTQHHDKETTDGTSVTSQMSVSIDGYYSGPHHVDAGFHWVTRWVVDAMAWRELQGYEGGEHNTSSEILAEYFGAAGAYVMGRTMFDKGEIPWGPEPPFHAPVFVTTSRPRETLVKGDTTFTFVTDGVASAVEQARAAAGDKNVAVAGGGEMLRQVIDADLLEELELHVVPLLLGGGMRLFGDKGALDAVELKPTRVVATPEATHVRYGVKGRERLRTDDRGRSGKRVNP
jgi:dihydrofolate reductase